MLTATAYRTSAHEAWHAAVAWAFGLRVMWMRRERDDSGSTYSVFNDDDPRSVKEKALIRAIQALAPTLDDPGYASARADKDIQAAEGYCRLGGITLDEATDATRKVLKRKDVQDAHGKLLDASLHDSFLVESDVNRILKG